MCRRSSRRLSYGIRTGATIRNPLSSTPQWQTSSRRFAASEPPLINSIYRRTARHYTSPSPGPNFSFSADRFVTRPASLLRKPGIGGDSDLVRPATCATCRMPR